MIIREIIESLYLFILIIGQKKIFFIMILKEKRNGKGNERRFEKKNKIKGSTFFFILKYPIFIYFRNIMIII